MERTEVSRNQLVNQLLHIGHGDLSIYNDIGLKAVKAEPELFAHLIAWNHKKGEVRDSKKAFPAIALRGASDKELYENAVAHLCLLDPRNLLSSLVYSKCGLPQIGDGGKRILKEGVSLYLRKREEKPSWWNRTAVQHRKSLKSLYKIFRIKPSVFAQWVLFDRSYPPDSIFALLGKLKDMDPQEAAGTILNHEIPFLIAVGALGGIKDKPDVILALMERMSGAELINNTATLKRWGAFDNPALKASYDEAMKRTAKDSRVSTLKASKAIEVVSDKKAKGKLKQIQEQKLERLGGIEGDWLVEGDRSGSMEQSIKVASYVAAFIAQQVKGKVHLIFFNENPTYYDVTGKSLEEIVKITARVRATGGTSIGCGLQFLHEKGLLVNGIAICSDGGDNTYPYFHEAYGRYVAKFGIEPTVYLFHVPGDPDDLSRFCKGAKMQLEKFELGHDVDYYSLPNIIKTLRTSKYSLCEEIMEMPLLKFGDVFK